MAVNLCLELGGSFWVLLFGGFFGRIVWFRYEGDLVVAVGVDGRFFFLYIRIGVRGLVGVWE